MPNAKKKQANAYISICTHVAHLSHDIQKQITKRCSLTKQMSFRKSFEMQVHVQLSTRRSSVRKLF